MYQPRHKGRVNHVRARTLAAGVTVAGIAGGGQFITAQQASADGALTPSQVTAIAKEGCPQLSGQALDIAVKLTTPESGRDPSAVGDGGNSFGLWQIHQPSHPSLFPDAASSPVGNARAMCQVSNGGQNFSPWTTYTDGSYQSAPGATTGGIAAPVQQQSAQQAGTYGRPVPGQIIQVFRNPGSGYALGYHTGVDFAADLGDAVRSAGPGVVASINQSGAPYGNHVVVKHPDGVYTLYAHLSAIKVTVGQSVTHDTTVGLIGSTGHSSGAHLHFEARNDATAFSADVFRDPIAWLNGHAATKVTPTPKVAETPKVAKSTGNTYTVKSGDWLVRIAREELGDANKWCELYDLNRETIGDNPSLIRPGQILKLPAMNGK